MWDSITGQYPAKRNSSHDPLTAVHAIDWRVIVFSDGVHLTEFNPITYAYPAMLLRFGVGHFPARAFFVPEIRIRGGLGKIKI
jgi:hypothetical protein